MITTALAMIATWGGLAAAGRALVPRVGAPGPLDHLRRSLIETAASAGRCDWVIAGWNLRLAGASAANAAAGGAYELSKRVCGIVADDPDHLRWRANLELMAVRKIAEIEARYATSPGGVPDAARWEADLAGVARRVAERIDAGEITRLVDVEAEYWRHRAYRPDSHRLSVRARSALCGFVYVFLSSGMRARKSIGRRVRGSRLSITTWLSIGAAKIGRARPSRDFSRARCG